MVNTFDYIESNPDILGGSPVIKGTRIDVSTIKSRLGGGETLEALAAEYPEIPLSAFEAAYKYEEMKNG